MTTCRDIIKRAYHMAGIVAIGDDPTSEESAYALGVLQSFYDSLFNDGMFGRFSDVYADTDYTAKAGERVIADGADITLPDIYEDPETGKNRVNSDLDAVIVVADGAQYNFVFSGGFWEQASNLALADDAPLATRSQTGLSACLAMLLVPAFADALVSPEYRALAGQFKGSLSYKMTTRSGEVEYF